MIGRLIVKNIEVKRFYVKVLRESLSLCEGRDLVVNYRFCSTWRGVS